MYFASWSSLSIPSELSFSVYCLGIQIAPSSDYGFLCNFWIRCHPFSELSLRYVAAGVHYVTGIKLLHDTHEEKFVHFSTALPTSRAQESTLPFSLQTASSNHAFLKFSVFLSRNISQVQQSVPQD
jgi:hypothetical protein